MAKSKLKATKVHNNGALVDHQNREEGFGQIKREFGLLLLLLVVRLWLFSPTTNLLSPGE